MLPQRPQRLGVHRASRIDDAERALCCDEPRRAEPVRVGTERVQDRRFLLGGPGDRVARQRGELAGARGRVLRLSRCLRRRAGRRRMRRGGAAGARPAVRGWRRTTRWGLGRRRLMLRPGVLRAGGAPLTRRRHLRGRGGRWRELDVPAVNVGRHHPVGDRDPLALASVRLELLVVRGQPDHVAAILRIRRAAHAQAVRGGHAQDPGDRNAWRRHRGGWDGGGGRVGPSRSRLGLARWRHHSVGRWAKGIRRTACLRLGQRRHRGRRWGLCRLCGGW